MSKQIDKGIMAHQPFLQYCKTYPLKSKKQNQKDSQEFWNAIKDKSDFVPLFDEKVRDLKQTVPKGSLLKFLQPKPIPAPTKTSIDLVPSTSRCSDLTEFDDVFSSDIEQQTSTQSLEEKNRDIEQVLVDLTPLTTIENKPRPKQETLQKSLNIVNADISGLTMRQENGSITEDQIKELKKVLIRRKDIERQLRRVENDRIRHIKIRSDRKRKLELVMEENPSLRASLGIRDRKGHPSIVEDQPALLDTITKIAQYGSLAHDRRRSDALRSIRTIKDLRLALSELGINSSQSGLYYHLLPRNAASIDGKRHMKTAPVRLVRAEKSLRKWHEDSLFAKATIDHINELASLLGPNDVAIISQDDKARVPIGTIAANAQLPLLMHMEYRVSLPDHTWVVAERHKLIPSVYAILEVRPNGYGNKEHISYSG